MEGNICARCLESVIGQEGMWSMKSVRNWNNKCEICGDTAVFYARQDELKKAKELLKD